MSERTVVLRPGDPIPPNQTTGKAKGGAAGGSAGGVAGGAIGGILTSVVVTLVEELTGEQLSGDTIANIGILCTLVGGGIGAAVGGWWGAYQARNFLK